MTLTGLAQPWSLLVSSVNTFFQLIQQTLVHNVIEGFLGNEQLLSEDRKGREG